METGLRGMLARIRNRELLRAAERGRLDTVRKLLAPAWFGWLPAADANTRSEDWGTTPLHKAASAGHADVCSLLIQCGADVNVLSGSGWTPLYLASMSGHAEVAALLIERGADVDARNCSRGDETALWRAVFQGHEDVVRLLIEKGADVDFRYESGERALYWAAHRGHEGVVRLLLRSGAREIDGRRGAADGKQRACAAVLDEARATPAASGTERPCTAGLNGLIPPITAQQLGITLVESNALGAPGPGEAAIQRAIQCVNARDANGAIDSFDEAIRVGLDPLREGYAHASLGELELKRKNATAAIAHLLKVLTYNQALYESVHHSAQYLSVILAELGRQQEAEALQRLAVRTGARLGYSLSPEMAGDVRRLVRAG